MSVEIESFVRAYALIRVNDGQWTGQGISEIFDDQAGRIRVTLESAFDDRRTVISATASQNPVAMAVITVDAPNTDPANGIIGLAMYEAGGVFVVTVDSISLVVYEGAAELVDTAIVT